jgi:hypothetical protein
VLARGKCHPACLDVEDLGRLKLVACARYLIANLVLYAKLEPCLESQRDCTLDQATVCW